MSKECLVQINDVVSIAQAGPFFGRKVVWKTANRKVAGRIVGLHGKNGVVRVKFNKAMPGQAIGTIIEILRLAWLIQLIALRPGSSKT